MRVFVVGSCMLFSTSCWAQNIVSNPSGSQVIRRPASTEADHLAADAFAPRTSTFIGFRSFGF